MKPCGSTELSERSIHVWTLRIRSSGLSAREFEPILASDEKQRAGRIHFGSLRDSFVVTRGVLRCLLGRYLDLDPSSIQFNYGPKGKPALASGAFVDFNIAHSANMAVFAFTVNCRIGIDVEQIKPLPETYDIATRFFCLEEAAEIMSLPPSERETAFFRCWTRKEAYIKALGEGLSAPLNSFRVKVTPNESAALLHFANDTSTTEAWTLHDLSIASGYIAALAYQDRPRAISVLSVSDSGPHAAASKVKTVIRRT